MPVDLRETRLPGVGVKYTFSTALGGRVAVIMHVDGQREIYFYRRSDDDEPTAVIELHDDESRQLGAIIGGAYERPKIVEELEMALGSSTSNGSRYPTRARRSGSRWPTRACVPARV